MKKALQLKRLLIVYKFFKMKRIYTVIFILFTCFSFSQEEKTNKISFNSIVQITIARNTNYGEYDYYTGEADKNIFTFGAVFLRTGVDYKLNRIIPGIYTGIDAHFESDVYAIPLYFETKYVIASDDDDIFYLSGAMGRLLPAGTTFEKGKYAKIGLGYVISSYEKKNSTILTLDFHQKNIDDFASGKLNSLSLGLGISF